MDAPSQSSPPSIKGKPVFQRPSASIAPDPAKEEAQLSEKKKQQANKRVWLVFYALLAGLIIVALICDVPDWFQITGLILLLGCWVPKTLWNHRAVFRENKMATLTSVIGLTAVLLMSFRRSLHLDKHSGLYAAVLVFGMMLATVFARLIKKHGSL